MWRAAGLLAVVFLGAQVTWAQAPYYAGKTIEVIVPFAPGGAADVGGAVRGALFGKARGR